MSLNLLKMCTSLFSYIYFIPNGCNAGIIRNLLKLSVLTNQQRIQKGLEPAEAASAENLDDEAEKFDQDVFENVASESESEIITEAADKSGKRKVNSRKKSENQVYSCKHCGKVLSSRGNLKKHEIIHLNVKPWQCKDCNLTFNQARDLKTHQMQKHSGERPHSCKVKQD